MGGTSCEVCLVRGGRPAIASAWNWRHRYVIGLPMVEMHAIGAGGGSIARVEDGVLAVGPRSAGAVPGPICYGRGGSEPTVTDANLLLGYLNPDALCGGDFKLASEGVREAMLERIGRPLSLDAVEAAWGIFRIVNANMNNAIRRVTCERGVDPRDLQLVVYGGNGPVHAGRQAEELGIRNLLIPRSSPAFSALGLLLADYRLDRQRSYLATWKQADVAHVAGIFRELEGLAEDDLRAAGARVAEVVHERLLHICYPGQTFDMAVPAADGAFDADALAASVEAFHDLHESIHTFAARDEEPILRCVRVRTRGVSRSPGLPGAPSAAGSLESAIVARRPAFFGDGFVGDTGLRRRRAGPRPAHRRTGDRRGALHHPGDSSGAHGPARRPGELRGQRRRNQRRSFFILTSTPPMMA